MEENQMLGKILEAVNSLQQDMSGVKSEISGIKSDMTGMKSEISGIKSDMKEVDRKMQAMEHRLISQFNMIIEQKVSKEIRLIAEQHGDIVEKQRQLGGLDEEVDQVKGRVSTLEDVVELHTQSIDELKQAQ